MDRKVVEKHTITVDTDKPTEKAYQIVMTFDLANLTNEDLLMYAIDAITVKTVNPLRKKGHQHLAGLNGRLYVTVPRPGTRTAVSSEEGANQFVESAELEQLEKLAKRIEEAKKARIIVRKPAGGHPGKE